MSRADHSDYDCFGCAILTHGSDRDVLYASDGEIKLAEFTRPFGAGNCKSLAGKPKLFFIQVSLSQTLLWNPRVEQGNPNICAKVNLCLFFYLFRLKKWFAARLKLLIQLASTKFKLICLKTPLHKQTETTVSN